MSTGTVDHLFLGATTEVIAVHRPEGDRPAFLLVIAQIDGKNQRTEHSIVIPPDRLQALCSLLQEALHAQGYSIPEPPQSGMTPKH